MFPFIINYKEGDTEYLFLNSMTLAASANEVSLYVLRHYIEVEISTISAV